MTYQQAAKNAEETRRNWLATWQAAGAAEATRLHGAAIEFFEAEENRLRPVLELDAEARFRRNRVHAETLYDAALWR